ncbi:MAG: lipopolysaccharide kinase InaA family protein [bacterium]|nr:lipopolysaccharide kinase InaA family protein [bacterium]
MRGPSHTKRVTRGDLILYLDPEYDIPRIYEFIEAIRSGDLSQVSQLESSEYARVYRFELPAFAGHQTFYCKEFLFRSPGDRLLATFRKSRARRAWEGATLLLNHRFHTARPVALVEDRTLGIVRRNFLLTEALEGAKNLDAYLEDEHVASSGEPSGTCRKRAVIALLGRTIGRMHRMGVFPGDLRVRNILVQNSARLRVAFIDNERTGRSRHMARRKILKNLVQVNMILSPAVSATDRVRFFHAYLQENPGLANSRKGRREWMDRIQRRARARLSRKGYI